MAPSLTRPDRKQGATLWVAVSLTLLAVPLLSHPVQAAPTPNAAVAAGWKQTCILKAIGTVDCYGLNEYGEANDYAGGDAVAVSAGGFATCILKATGNVDCQGLNNMGQTEDYTGGFATAVSTGGLHTCILTASHNVLCWGYNSDGQSNNYLGGDATAVQVGNAHTCVLKGNGNVDCYGRNTYGESNDYTGGDAVGVFVGNWHTCVVKSNGNVDCYGINANGESNDYSGGDAVAGAAGWGHTCILKTNKNVDCYGSNGSGEGADYTGGDAYSVAVGDGHTCILKTNAIVDCRGANSDGQAYDYGYCCTPGAPRNVAATTGTERGKIVLSWQPPASDGGVAITNYKLYRGTASGAETVYVTLGNVLSYTDSGLGDGTTRYYKVLAVNDLGESPPSNEASATTLPPPTAPTAPQDLQASWGVAKTVLAWQAPASNGGSSVTGYRIYRGSSSGGETQIATVSSYPLTYTDTGCFAPLPCYYKVGAVNSVGTGPLSDEATWHIP